MAKTPKETNPDDRPISVRLPRDLYEKLAASAEASCRTISGEVIFKLREVLQ